MIDWIALIADTWILSERQIEPRTLADTWMCIRIVKLLHMIASILWYYWDDLDDPDFYMKTRLYVHAGCRFCTKRDKFENEVLAAWLKLYLDHCFVNHSHEILRELLDDPPKHPFSSEKVSRVVLFLFSAIPRWTSVLTLLLST